MSTDQELFRSEVLHEANNKWLGSPLTGSAMPARLLPAIALLSVAALVVCLTFIDYQQKIRADGLVVPANGFIEIDPQQDARIRSIAVVPGQRVKAGDRLVEFSADRQLDQGTFRELQAKELRERLGGVKSSLALEQLKVEARNREVADKQAVLKARIEQLTQDREALDRRIDLSERTLNKFNELAGGGYVSELQRQQREDEMLDLTTRRRSVAQSIREAENEIKGLTADRRQSALGLELVEQQLSKEAAQLNEQANELASRTVWAATAPADALVLAVRGSAGSHVAAGEPVVSLTPVSGGEPGWTVRLSVPAKVLPELRRGDPVILKVDSLPYQKYGTFMGAISDISPAPVTKGWAAPISARAATAAEGGESLYEVRVDLDLDKYSDKVRAGFKPGVIAEASIVHHRQPLWRWFAHLLLRID